jgi:phospholipid/cholesterol/gamma-HCH transport system substrate-binding protein
METRAPFVLVGGAVVVLVACLVVAVLWFAQIQFREQVAYYDIYFTGSVTGLTPGTTVRYNGIPVGRVAEVKLDPVDPGKVRVTVELQGGTAVKTDTVASVELQGLAGGSFVNLTGGTREAPLLARKAEERYPVIESRASGLQQVVTSAPEVMSRLLEVANQLADVLNEQNRKALSDTLQNMRQVSAAAASHSGDIDSALAESAQTVRSLRTTLDSANAILETLKQTIAPDGQMQVTLRSVTDTSRKIADLSQRIDRLVADNEAPLHDFTRGGLNQVQALVEQTQLLVTQLSRIADSIERDPSRFIYGDQRKGYQPK